MLRNSKSFGWTLALIGAAFMFGLALVLPATAQIAQQISPSQLTGHVLESAQILKISLMSLLAFSTLLTLTGLALLAHNFFTTRKPAA